MELTTDELLQCMKELRISEKVREECGKYSEAGQYEKLYTALRGARQQLLEELHETQKRLDCLDCLIYSVKKKKCETDSAEPECDGKKEMVL